MSTWVVWLMLAQAAAGLPAMTPGTEVRLVSLDLLTIHATARVDEGVLRFQEPLPANLEVRVLVFPPGASDAERAQALAGGAAFRARVAPDGRDLLIQLEPSDDYRSLRDLLREQRGVTLLIPEEGDGP